MANFDQLKQSVAALIRTNGAEEITGQIMQDVLLTIINSISGGYMFGGVAQHNGNVGNPDYNVFYLAGSGAYTGYGDAINIPNGCYGVFRYNGSWTQDVVDIGVHLTGTIREGETNGVTGDVINTALQTLFNNIMNILDTLTFTYNTPSAQQATKAMLDVIVTPTGGASHVLTTLTLVSATAAAAGLMSAEDKQKVDRMLTDFRSLSFSDTTAAADQATKIVQTLYATLGENPEAITTMTFLEATASKAGLLSAADKAKLDALWSSGYQFAGIATPSTTPVSTTSKIFYIATEAGTYFNAVTVTQGINILSWNGTSWSAVQVVGIDDEPTADSKNLVKSSGVALNIISKDFANAKIVRKNLFDPSNPSKVGYYINSEGNYVESSSLLCSPIIPVEENADYFLSTYNGDPVGNINAYGFFYLKDGSKTLFSTNDESVHTPLNCVALEFSYVNSRRNIQLEKGNARTEYEMFISDNNLNDIVNESVLNINSLNLIGNHNEIPNCYVNDEGTLVPNNNYTTYKVNVEAGKRYYVSSTDHNDMHPGMFAFMTKNNAFISIISNPTTFVTAPDNAAYAYISFNVDIIYRQFTLGEQISYRSGDRKLTYELVKDYIDPISKDAFSTKEIIDESIENVDSINLVGNYNEIANHYVNGNGELIYNTGYKTYKVNVIGNSVYYLNASDHSDINPGMLAFMDNNNDFISFLSNPTTATAPANAAYMYVSFYTEVKYMQITLSAQYIYISGDRVLNYSLIAKYLKEVGLIEPDVVFPRNEYVLQGEQNSFYHQAYMNNYNPNSFYVDKNGGSWKYFERCWRVESTDTASDLNFVLRSRKTQEIISTHQIAVRRGLKTNTANLCRINAIGDSFCYGGYYLKQMYEMCGNSEFVGMRKSQRYSAEAPIYCEGRGGWTLSSYFNPISTDVTPTHAQPFSPFMHASGYNYYGDEDFWKLIVNGTSQYSYGTAGFDKYVSWFGTDGRKLNPSNNDLMYNHTSGKYEKYDGSQWVELDAVPTFAFDYSEYIRIWQIDAPDFVVIQLGTNDFFYGNINFENWCSQMDEVIDSINAYSTSISKDIKILLCTVLTISSLPNNVYGDGDIKRNYFYWLKRKQVIERYDPSTEQVNRNVYVVDTGIVVDDKYGFLTEERKPFDYYEGEHREMYDINGVHPDVGGYKQFGNPIAAAIQYLRS